ncbi:AsmA family protein, partial [Sedimenticola sp.]|uniref:DUF748 domain-containing protein n=1 Tax=Sedimenticola sp. TaxID=1940285 RepID=UPI003D147FD4
MTTAVPHKRRRRLLITFTTLLILLVATLALLPAGISYGLKQWLQEHGGEQVSVGNIDFNPFTATFRLDNLDIVNKGVNTLTLPRLDLQLAWRPLWNKRLVVTGLDLSGVRLKLVQTDKNSTLKIGGLLFSTPTDKEPATTDWAIRLDHIGLRDSELDYQGPKFSSRIKVDMLDLDGIASDKKSHISALDLQAHIDQTPVKLHGEVMPFADTPSFDGDIQIDD